MAIAFAKHYSLLSGSERFVAMMEAMARNDETEMGRLDDSCPRAEYTIDDPAYRERMAVSAHAASFVCASINRDLDMIRGVHIVRDIANLHEFEVEDGAIEAFRQGWKARDKLVGGDGSAEPDLDDEAIVEQLAKLMTKATENVNVGLTVAIRSVTKNRARHVVSTWDGFGRFTRECCHVEPLVLAKAWRFLEDDPEADVRELYPEVVIDQAKADRWYNDLVKPWRKRIDGGPE